MENDSFFMTFLFSMPAFVTPIAKESNKIAINKHQKKYARLLYKAAETVYNQYRQKDRKVGFL